MKAVIVECSNGAAVALCDDGTFRKLKNRGYSIGQELILQQKASANRMMRKLSVCASLALVLLSFAGIGSYSYVSPYSFVSLDINPSIEYALNRYDKVISVSGINEEGQQIVSSIESDVKNQNITTAIGVTIRQLEIDNYIVEEEYNHVIVSVCSDNDTKARAIASRVDTFSTEEVQVCAIDTMTVTKEIKDSADSLGITPGKLALIHAVAETTADSDFDMSEWTGMTVSELETTIQQASSQLSSPATVSAINSEYLSNALDENAAQKEGSVSKEESASNEETGADTGSTSTDQQTDTTNTTDGSNAAADSSVSKPDTVDSSINDSNTNAADSTANSSAAENQNGSTAGSDAAGSQNGSAADSSTASNGSNGESNSSTGNTVNGNTDAVPNNNGNAAASNNNNTAATNGNNSTGSTAAGAGNNNTANGGTASDLTNNTAGQDTSAKPSDKNGGNDDILTEDNSSKKDSYPLQGTDKMEDSSNTSEEPAGTEDSVVNGEAQEDQDIGISEAEDSAGVESDGLLGQIGCTELDDSAADKAASGAETKMSAETDRSVTDLAE